MDARFVQAQKEALWSVVLTLIYLAMWGFSAWLGGSRPGLTGLPLWFELSCLFAPVMAVILCWLMVRFLFRDMPLEDMHER